MDFPKTIESIYFDIIDSTHEWAKKNISTFNPSHLTAITACLQSSGRGRMKHRQWISKEGNLHFTGFFTLPKTIPNFSNISQILILTIAQILENENVILQIKWPNDLFYKNKKLGGALTELIDSGERWGCIASMGVNVSSSVETDQPTTCLQEISSRDWKLDVLLANFLKKLQSNLALFTLQGFFPFQADFNRHLAFKNKKVTCIAGDKKISGILSAVTEEGKLQLLQNDDSITELSTGEIHTLRESVKSSSFK